MSVWVSVSVSVSVCVFVCICICVCVYVCVSTSLVSCILSSLSFFCLGCVCMCGKGGVFVLVLVVVVVVVRIPIFPGLRLVKLPLLECIVSFVGSANNNIKRNSKMIAALCLRFKQNLLVDIDISEAYEKQRDTDSIPKDTDKLSAGDMNPELLVMAALFRFPSLNQLSSLSEKQYLDLG